VWSWIFINFGQRSWSIWEHYLSNQRLNNEHSVYWLSRNSLPVKTVLKTIKTSNYYWKSLYMALFNKSHCINFSNNFLKMLFQSAIYQERQNWFLKSLLFHFKGRLMCSKFLPINDCRSKKFYFILFSFWLFFSFWLRAWIELKVRQIDCKQI